MKIAVAVEATKLDRRTPLLPGGAKKLVELGAQVAVESGLGASVGIDDAEYQSAGVEIAADAGSLLASADMVLRLNLPSEADVERLREGTTLISFLDPFNQPALLATLASRKITGICMEMIPRTTLAQKMDALSSQANLAGYVAVILAANSIDKILPMMTTPAGTISPVRVFVIGAGVAGLQAIATAKRLGAIVEAYDTRPVVEEQVRSVGGRFVKFDLGETGQTEQGYARQLTEEQLARQQEAMAKHCEKSDVVITTAQVFGRKAPRIITTETVARMRPGSVLVDLAVETGGNIEGSRLGETVIVNGVKILGQAPLPALVPLDASQMYSSNLVNLISHFWNKDAKQFDLRLDDEIIEGCLLTHEGQIRNERFK